eukprot:CAMPEP_0171792332 /NCGR_PEP_ID=MMETSP0991-20121206/66892_1 /TAXON_ID=483369 /ORGANISM="non described non described, Strain CCMP2098" /LENGTH=135 /DNA_ID=CAMNT_0012402373 /DNA_START=206 /DNA_END=609 /DNA_ORIENTATION=-
MAPEKTVASKGGTVKKQGPPKNLAAKTQTKSNTFKAKNVEGGAAFSKQEISDWKRQATRGNGDPEASTSVLFTKARNEFQDHSLETVNAAQPSSKSRKLVMNRMAPEKTVASKGGTVKKQGPPKNLAAKTQTKSN